MQAVRMASAQLKQPAVADHIQNGKSSVQHESASGSAPNSAAESNSSRKERRKEWWDKKRKSKPMSNDHSKRDIHATQLTKEETKEEEEEDSDNQKSKLRNRETIAKPDSLKYEPDFNRGFHSKLMQNLYKDTSKKKKKKKDKEKPSESASSSPSKRKPTAAASSDQENAKKPKTEETEVFDSYKFSLNLINGEVDTSKSPEGKDSKNKYVLFIGNLPYDITREQLEEHFRKTGGIKSIRIPREKGTDKGRGFAYMEFDGRISHGIALRLHQTTLGGRKINVEFTSIGGGKSEARREKLKQKNKKRRKMKMNW